MSEKPMTECCQTNCDQKATYKFFWPNKGPAGSCDKHMAQLKGLAGVMGFYLHCEQLGTFDIPEQEAKS